MIRGTASPRHTLVLFDLDGTMLSTLGAGLRAMQRAGRLLFGDLFDMTGVEAGGMLDGDLFAAAFRASGFRHNAEHLAMFIEAYASELAAEIERTRHDVRILPGVASLLEAVHAHEHTTLGMLTGNFARTGPIKLAAVGIDVERFVVRVYADDGPDRPSLVPVGMKRYAAHHGRPIDPRDVIVVGDTPRDVACAHAHGARCLAVATGPYPYETLVEAGADVTVRDLRDATPLWDMMAAESRVIR